MAPPPSTAHGRLASIALPKRHAVQFYESEEFLHAAVANFLAGGLEAGEPVIVIATEPHQRAFTARLAAKGIDVEKPCASGRLVLLDARDTLTSISTAGEPDWELFRSRIGGLIEEKRALSGADRVRAFGEMVDLLWKDGKPKSAIRLEEMWNDLGRLQDFTLLCAYAMGNFLKEADGAKFEQVGHLHTHVVPAESYSENAHPTVRMHEITVLQQRAQALEAEVAHRKELEKALREALDDRRRAEQALRSSQEELVDFLENAAEGLHWVGEDGTILWANRAELEMLGYAEDEYVGHRIAEFHADEDVIADILARLTRGETIKEYEARLRCKDGSIRNVVVHSNVYFRDGKFVHTRCFTRDVTERRKLESELRHQNDELTRAVRFSEMFVGILGHDLRNPLSAIMTGASLLARRAESDKVAKPATRILTSAERMARMIDQILDFTRIRLGHGIPLQRRRIDLAEVCRLAIDEAESTGGGERIRLEEGGESVGTWDGDRLSQLISNLLGNALAHGTTGAPVVIRLDGTSDDDVVLELQNSGAVPPDVLPVLFDPFHSTSRKQERSSGLGLGLFISQQIVLAHAGNIEVTSSEEHGTRFIVRLPRNAPVPGPAFGGRGKA
jgi:PAS domain S-box-containing protein